MEAESASVAARKLAGKIQSQAVEEYSETDSSQLEMDSGDEMEGTANTPGRGGTPKQRWLAQRRRIRSALTLQRRRGRRKRPPEQKKHTAGKALPRKAANQGGAQAAGPRDGVLVDVDGKEEARPPVEVLSTKLPRGEVEE